MISICLPNQSASKKHSHEKKAHKPLHTPLISPKINLPCLIIIQSCYFDYRINKRLPYSHYVTNDLLFVLCSLDLDILSAQRIVGFFYLNYHTYQRGRKIRSHGCYVRETKEWLCKELCTYKVLIRYADKRRVMGKIKLGIIDNSAKSTGKTGFVIGFN